MPHLSVSASLKGKALTLTLCNLSATDALEVEIALHGGAAGTLGATTLAAEDIHAHNMFEQPETVAPKVGQASSLTHQTLPPASVTRVDIALVVGHASGPDLMQPGGDAWPTGLFDHTGTPRVEYENE